MRRLLVPALSLALILGLTAPSHGWWLFHHAHTHRGSYAAQPMAAPMAAPLAVGFQLPGGVNMTLTPDGTILQHLHQAMQNRLGQEPAAPARVTASADVVSTIDRVSAKTTSAADKLDALIQTINKDDSSTKLPPVDRTEAVKSPATPGGGTGTEIGAGLRVIPPQDRPK